MDAVDSAITPPALGKTAVFLQKACLQHRYIRSRDTSCIVERPERLRAVNIGLAAAAARLELFGSVSEAPRLKEESDPRDVTVKTDPADADELAAALGQLNLEPGHAHSPVQFVHSSASVDLSNNAAVKYVHGDLAGDVYLENLKKWAKESQEKIAKGGSEIPETLPQGDLYLCPTSIDSIQGALGTVCEAVDTVIDATRPAPSQTGSDVRASRAFVAVRPPGHHCGEDVPCGFCFVNNVAVAAAHAHLQHGINRVVVLDIDLHHGNGTQSIAWQINEETYRKSIEQAHGAPPEKPGLQMYYGSIHDILSFPCEDGKTELVQAASVSIHGPHGQHIENIHLQPYSSEKQFWDELYSGQYAKLLQKTGAFLEETGGPGDDVLVFISCGFDASEHEYPSMSRHHRHVPTSFYRQFALDARRFAERFARGRLISVLEGGYSDRALTSGAMAHLVGLVDNANVDCETWWSLDNLIELEKATKRRRGGRLSQPVVSAPWIERAVEIFRSIDSSHLVSPAASSRLPVPPSSRVLRERRTPLTTSADSSPEPSPGKIEGDRKPKSANRQRRDPPAKASSKPPKYLSSDSENDSLSSLSDIPEEGVERKKLPRVILRVGPPPSTLPHS